MKSIKIVCSILLLLFLFTSNPLHAQFSDGQIIYIQSAINGKQLYLMPKNAATSQRTPIVVQTKNSSNESACKWKLESAGGGWFYLRNVKSNLLLDVKDGSTKIGTELWLWPKNRSNAQKFKLNTFSNDRSLHLIASKLGSQHTIDLKSSTPNTNTACIVGKLTNGRRVQKWRITPASNALKIPRATFAGVANAVLNKLEIKLNNHGPRHRDAKGDVSWFKPNDSYIKLAGYNSKFTIPEYTRGIRDNRSYLNDMKLERVRTRFISNNNLSINLKFEENAPEIKAYCGNCIKRREDRGEPDYEFLNNQWEIRLSLIPFNGSIAYDVESVTFLGEVDGKVFGELWDNLVQDCMIPIFEKQMKQTLEGRKGQIARLIKDEATRLGIDLPYVTSIEFSGNDVLFYGR